MKGEYYHTEESVREYIQLAKDVNSRQLIEKFNEQAKNNALILELGSGPGTDWNILNQSHDVIGSDNSSEFIRHLNKTYPKGVFHQLDATTLETDRKFDGIYSNKVLHHLKNDEMTMSIKRQFEILNPGGIICHSFWKGEGSEVFKGLFVNYYNESELRISFERYFDILSIETYEEFDKDDSLLLIGKRK